MKFTRLKLSAADTHPVDVATGNRAPADVVQPERWGQPRREVPLAPIRSISPAQAAPVALPPAPLPIDPTCDFASIYRRHFHDCCRWLRAMGAPDFELEDLAQEVFLVVERKVASIPPHNQAGWIYGVAWRTLSDHRRRAWWKNLFERRRDADLDDMWSESAASPSQALEDRENGRILRRILDQMSPKRRVALVLFEIEGLSGEEIAVLEGIPLKTVWTRLHHARKDFLARAEAYRNAEAIREVAP